MAVDLPEQSLVPHQGDPVAVAVIAVAVLFSVEVGG